MSKLAELAESLRKTYSAGIQVVGENPATILSYKKRIPTGLKEMDRATGGGYVSGVTHELFGNEGEGKTTVALYAVAEAQKNGVNVCYVDAEHSLNLDYAKKIGVNIDTLLLVQPDYGEQALDIMQEVIQSGIVGLVVVDSVTALVPKADIDGDFTDANMGAHPRLMSKMCRVMTPLISKNEVVLLLINQIRMKIGVFFGSPETTTGGKAIKFYAQMRMRVSTSKIEGNEDSRNITVKFVKHKWGKMYDEANMVMDLGEGINKKHDLFISLCRKGEVEVKGSSYYYNGKHLGNGKKNASENLWGIIND